MTKDNDYHYHQKPKRLAEFFNPPNLLKNKVGIGGLSEDILNKAQLLLENNTVDFRPLGELYLDSLQRGLDQARENSENIDNETLIAALLYPAMQLKGNGGMFHYALVTRIADKLIQFLEVMETPDLDALEIVGAFHSTLKAILLAQIKGDGGKRGDELLKALVDACHRYFEKHPEKK